MGVHGTSTFPSYSNGTLLHSFCLCFMVICPSDVIHILFRFFFQYSPYEAGFICLQRIPLLVDIFCNTFFFHGNFAIVSIHKY